MYLYIFVICVCINVCVHVKEREILSDIIGLLLYNKIIIHKIYKDFSWDYRAVTVSIRKTNRERKKKHIVTLMPSPYAICISDLLTFCLLTRLFVQLVAFSYFPE